MNHDFSTDALAALAAEKELLFPRDLLAQTVAAIESGKHVMLTGVAGTGKTSLACLVSELANHSGLNGGHVAITASPNWSIADTIGRHVEGHNGMAFEAGIALEAIQSGSWLVIDEMNRADFDSSFGPLFTVLAGQPVTLPFRQLGHEHPMSLVPPRGTPPRNTEPIVIAPSWRIIATMNDFDKETLFRMSYGLMRRFAFIEVESLSDDEIRRLIEGPGELAGELLCVRSVVDLGAALFLDAARFIACRSKDGTSTSRMVYEAFYSYFLPQLSELDPKATKQLVETVSACLDAAERHALARVVSGMARQPKTGGEKRVPRTGAARVPS